MKAISSEHEDGRFDFEVVSGQPELFQKVPDPRPERVVHGLAALALHGDEHGVPAARPAQRRLRPLHLRMALGDGGVVGDGDGAFLRAEGLRRKRPHLIQALRIDAALGGQRIAHAGDSGKWSRGVMTTWAMASAPTLPALPLPVR